jgi:general secretion pathway protein B
MSFILDALKKSESDRQRQNGPALFEVKVAPPRTRLPAWAMAIAALLVVNLGIVMWLLMRHPTRTAPADGTPVTAAAPAAGSPAAGGAAGTPASAAAAPGTPPPTALARAPAAAPPLATAAMPPAAASEPPAGPGATAPSSLPSTPGAAVGVASAPGAASPPGAAATSTEGSNPDDYAPAEEASASAAGGAFSGRVRRGTASGVPLYQDAAATPGTQIPQLRLDLHVFAVRQQDRFVMINMHKLHEGDTTPEGVHVENITPEGAVLSYNGSRFLLPRE